MADDQPSALQREIDRFRGQLARIELAATQQLSAVYAETLGELNTNIAALSERIAEQRAASLPVNQSWLFQEQRYLELRRQTLQLMERYGQATGVVTTQAQAAAVRAGLVEAGRELAAVSGGSQEIASMAAGWASVPDESIQRMVGALQASTPLGQTLASYGPDAVASVNRALIQGLALGLGPRDTARQVQRALGVTRTRAEMLVRTETLRAANAALIAAFEESGVVTGWRWSASLSSRTCPACLALHGKTFPLSTPMHRHANCRCSASPIVEDLDDWETGDVWLKRQSPSVQEQVFRYSGGAEAAEAFRSGEVRLDDFVQLVAAKPSLPRAGRSAVGKADVVSWGQSYQARSLTAARKAAKAR